jgi:S-DNA-T family DNA segregation ATPase FtsK/SpoIIIE
MLELSTYEEIPHLNAPVVTQPKRARGVLWWAVEEMDRRYELMKDLGVRNIAMYNRAIVSGSTKGTKLGRKKKKSGVVVLEEKDVVATGGPHEGLDRSLDADMEEAEAHALMDAEPLPRIVIVVDELADLMLTVGREIEELLTRLAQKARASGIHLILATQRPSVNVITGLIKANFPARISFKVASKIDARTVMDTSGAEKLLGQGDMLFMSPGAGRIMRLHSPFVSDKEVHDIVEEIRAQGEPDYDEAIEKMISKMEESESSSSGGFAGDDEYDEFYDKAVALVVDKGQASTSMVQRAFRIGYNRAARILETMERDGVVGPADGSRPRQVLVGSIEP